MGVAVVLFFLPRIAGTTNASFWTQCINVISITNQQNALIVNLDSHLFSFYYKLCVLIGQKHSTTFSFLYHYLSIYVSFLWYASMPVQYFLSQVKSCIAPSIPFRNTWYIFANHSNDLVTLTSCNSASFWNFHVRFYCYPPCHFPLPFYIE